MTTRAAFEIGTEVELAFTTRNAAGDLADASRAEATLTAPDGTIYRHDDASLRLVIRIGVPAGEQVACTAEAATRLGITVAENAAGTGIVTAVFIGDQDGPWEAALHVEGNGIQRTETFTIQVARSRTGRAYTGNVEVS